MKKTDLTRNVIGYTDGERGRQECLTVERQRSQKTEDSSLSSLAERAKESANEESRRAKRASENYFSNQAPHRLASPADSSLAKPNGSLNTLFAHGYVFIRSTILHHFWAIMLYELATF